ncbi:MAG TPA: BREX-1 system adenine-specific DNA-methyltransferase PglX [Methylobacter sp.]|jgi:type II restriction/modification system DNA methylase subunit YeeA
MNTNNIKKYAPQARREFIDAVGKRLNQFGVYNKGKTLTISEPTFSGSVMQIDGNSFDAGLAQARKRLTLRTEKLGFDPLVEHVAYTWFNRLCAIRYMELKGDYLEHGLRVLSPSPSQGEGRGEGIIPEILDHAQDVADQLGLDRNHIVELKLAGNKDEELYRHLLLGQCHQLHEAMPFLFEALDDETELLLPDNLTRTDSILRGLVDGIPEQDWQQVEIIGWLYQFYISEKKDQVIGNVVKSEDIPAATQLFTPNWIVKYLLQNSVGRQWLMTYPDSNLKAQMEYYIEPAEQDESVKTALAEITPANIEPESIKVIDPACGSGHILVEAYDVLKAIYEERGYRSRDIPKLILENNLVGLDIDDRAAQLAGFALMMKAREDDRRIFTRDIKLNVLALQSTQNLNLPELWRKLALNKEAKIGVTESIFEDAQSNLIDALDDADFTTLQSVLVLFEQAKTFGSLIQVSADKAKFLHDLIKQLEPLIEQGNTYQKPAAKVLLPFVQQAWLLSQRYDAVIANPPYMGSKYQTPVVKKYLKDNFNGYEKDLFSAFIVRNLQLAKEQGQLGFMTPFVWMFISSYEKLREKLIDEAIITSLIQLEYSGFDGATVPICTFTLSANHIKDYVGGYIKLSNFKGHQNQAPKTLEAIQNKSCGWFYQAKPDDFKKISGSPVAYWVSDKVRDIFVTSQKLGDIADARQGLATADNDRFLRLWYETDMKRIGFGMANREQAERSSIKWFPFNKAGAFRKWYGNQDFVVNWENDGEEIRNFSDDKGKQRSVIRNPNYYFRSSVSWSDVTSSTNAFRFFPEGFIHGNVAHSIFNFSEKEKLSLLNYCNNKFCSDIIKILSPTLHFDIGYFNNLPYPKKLESYDLSNVDGLIFIAKADWNTYEISWDFQNNPLIVGWVCVTQQTESTDVGLRDKAANPTYKLSNVYADWHVQNRQTITEMQRLEQENNRLFIDAYGLQDELEPDVPLEQITLTVNPKYRYGGNLSDAELAQRFQSDTLAELISYGIGCMMGRYRIDKPGLIYAHAGNIDFDKIYNVDTTPTQNPFVADDDGIIPLTDQEWFKDDATNRFRDFVRTVWGEDNLQVNLDFVAESLCLNSLKPKKSESSLETIRRYLSTEFYKDHLKTYKKRPIYWLFSSGKQKAFECLVYLHRYNESTMPRMRTEYVTPLLGKYDSFAVQLNKQIEDATTSEATQLKKELIALEKKQTELREFDDKLKHYADMRIKLDLDDGVKVNYGKFGDLLADVKAVTGSKENS